MRVLCLLVAVGLAGCGDPAPSVKTPSRHERAAVAMAKPPVVRSYPFGASELRVIAFPIQDIYGFVETQHCNVWRDAEFKQATLSCGQMPEVLLTGPDHR